MMDSRNKISLTQSDSLLQIKDYFKNKTPRDKIKRDPPVIFPSKSDGDVSVFENRKILWIENGKKENSERFLFSEKKPADDALNVQKYLTCQYSEQVPGYEFFERLIKVSLGNVETKEVADIFYKAIPETKRIDFIKDLSRAELKCFSNQQTFGRETNLASKLLFLHFQALYKQQFDKVIERSLVCLKRNKPKFIFKGVDSVLKALSEIVKPNDFYDMKRLYRQLYLDSLKHKGEESAKKQINVKFFLLIVNPSLMDIRLSKVKDPSYCSAITAVSKIIQCLVNDTKPRGLGFDINNEFFLKRKKIIDQIIQDLISLD